MTILKIFISTIIAINCLSVKAMEPLEPWERVNMTEEEFILVSSVVEAESNRDPENIDGRTMIAVCILNRVRDSRFPDTVTGVLTAPGQFSTVRGGHSVTSRTDLSDQAVIEAYNWIEQGDAPEVLYFNCRGYFSGIEAYDLVGGNYFSCDGGIR
jgi:hypothetical protein